jgi:hypothetical protein
MELAGPWPCPGGNIEILSSQTKFCSMQLRCGSESMIWPGVWGGPGLQELVGLVVMYWDVNSIMKFFTVKPWPLTARVAGAAWILALPCWWHWNFDITNLFFIMDAKLCEIRTLQTQFWSLYLRCGSECKMWPGVWGAGLGLHGLVEMYWRVNIMKYFLK